MVVTQDFQTEGNSSACDTQGHHHSYGSKTVSRNPSTILFSNFLALRKRKNNNNQIVKVLENYDMMPWSESIYHLKFIHG